MDFIHKGNYMKILSGKTAIVTGSTSGIGLAIAHSLANAGANIMLNGFGDLKEIEKIRDEMESRHGCKVAYCGADVSNGEAVSQMVVEALEKLGSVDIIVNNAGIQHVCPISDFPDEKWHAIMGINLFSAFKLTKEALPYMLKKNWGRIINIASAHGLVASPFKSAYVAAKHGMVGLTKTVALETAETNITCNVVCPGYVKTPLVEKQIVEQAIAHGISEERVVKEVLLASQPNKKFILPEHLGDLVAFLCSPAGDSMTGEIISMDGGWTAH